MGWHADDEPEMGNVIGSLSLGATRKFRIRHNITSETKTFLVGNGTLAGQNVCQDAVAEGLFRAYFTEGRDISNHQTLIDVAAEAGLDQEAADTMLNSDEGMNVIQEAGELSRRHGVTGVPFFIINQKLTLSGAQQEETFIEAFRQAVV